jgi:hypothetical protein
MNIIDELGELYLQLKPMQDRYEKLKKEIAELAAANASESSVQLRGQNYVIKYSAPAQQRELRIPIEQFIAKVVEPNNLWDVVTISTTKCEKAGLKIDRFFSTTPGSRRLVDVVKL